MKILLLNWKNGENDPFTYFNKCLQNKLYTLGKRSEILELNENFENNFLKNLKEGIDFVITWQGIASNFLNKKTGRNLWDEVKVPLFCLHGDHPCHKLQNHTALSDYIHHIYLAPSFCRYANQFIPRATSAKFAILPNIFPTASDSDTHFSGDYFIFPKNHDDTQEMIRFWEEKYPQHIAKTLKEIAEAIKTEYLTSNLKDHHEIIETFIDQDFLEKSKSVFNTNNESLIRNHIHAITDKFYRNFISENILTSLPDVKIQIYGRGWERFKALNNKYHSFYSFDKAINGDFQFQSNYGILDVAPITDTIHDRTLRALSQKNGFLIASSWNTSFFLNQEFKGLFFSGKNNLLRNNVENIIKDPDTHRSSAAYFKNSYNQFYGFHQFLNYIESQT